MAMQTEKLMDATINQSFFFFFVGGGWGNFSKLADYCGIVSKFKRAIFAKHCDVKINTYDIT